MGSSSSKTVTTDRYVREVRQVRTGMSDRDRRLYNFARIKIVEENLDDAQITVGFQDQEAIVLTATYNPSAKVYIGYNIYGHPEMFWQKRGFWRSVKSFFVDCFRSLKGALLDALAIGASAAMKSIGYY
ncbi:uncharacterized protein LOC128557670 [Mercenaria mercenaria]|uniref:uncharacterized protein LOC128557670 n=1 Tax=Mercenaria mercenaria TaxID=6596 RepID=UPI00234F1EF4|nr:uncharacterized protein LOC128557670 [Mercenaria mercenaria]XP_053401538.1 uncharacterized protein LOC128557670 [Mercenaria mercenaria]